jgi:hypothetical protein
MKTLILLVLASVMASGGTTATPKQGPKAADSVQTSERELKSPDTSLIRADLNTEEPPKKTAPEGTDTTIKDEEPEVEKNGFDRWKDISNVVDGFSNLVMALFTGALIAVTWLQYQAFKSSESRAVRAENLDRRAEQRMEEHEIFSQEVLRKQLRAYVSVVLVEGSTHFAEVNGFDTFFAQIKLINSGVTPASNVKMHSIFELGYKPSDYVGAVPTGYGRISNSESYIKTMSTPFDNSDIAQFNKTGAARGYVFIKGIVEYEDIFEVQQKTEFCYRADFRRGASIYEQYPEGNHAT